MTILTIILGSALLLCIACSVAVLILAGKSVADDPYDGPFADSDATPGQRAEVDARWLDLWV